MTKEADGFVEVEIRAKLEALDSSLQEARHRLTTFAGQTKGAQNALGGLNKTSVDLSSGLDAAARSLRSITEGIIRGTPLTTMLGRQFDHLAHAVMGPDGVNTAFDVMEGSLAGLFTRSVAVFGGIAATTLTAGFALNSFLSSQQDVERALKGMGRASGASVGDINRIASEGSSVFGLSVSEARKFASTLATVGRIGRNEIGDLVKLGHDFAAAYGIKSKEAAQTLAKAMADPVRGADDLNQRLGFMDAAMQRQIKNLTEQNRLAEAQRLIMDGIKDATKNASDMTGFWSKAWTGLSNAASNAYNWLGNELADLTGLGQTLEKQLSNAAAHLEQLRKHQPVEDDNSSIDILGLMPRGASSAEIAKAAEDVDKLRQKLDDARVAADAAQQRLQSFQIAATARQFLPEVDQFDKLKNAHALLVRTMIDIQVTGGRESDILKKTGLSYEQYADAVRKADFALKTFLGDMDRTIKSTQTSIDAITAFSSAAKGEIAARRIREQYAGTNADPLKVDQLAELARVGTLKEFYTQLSEAQRERMLGAKQQTQLAQVEIDMIGKTVGEQYRLQAEVQARQILEQEAARNRENFNEKYFEALKKQIELKSRLVQIDAEMKLASDVAFERQLIGLSDINQQIARRLRTAHGDSWALMMDSDIAQAMRLNEVLKQTSDIGRDALKGFVQDLVAGKSATEALTGVLNKIANKLIDMAINDLWGNALGGGGSNSGGLLSMLFGVGGGMLNLSAKGGTGQVGTGHSGAVIGVSGGHKSINPLAFIGVPRFHGGGLLSADEVPFIGKKGEEVGWPKDLARKYGGTTTITIGGPTIIVEGDASEKTLALIETKLAAYSANLKPTIVKTVREVSSRRMN